MGTRADFYLGVGPEAEWLGSFAFDGYPDAVADDLSLTEATPNIASEADWRESVAGLLQRDDATLPDAGWPWPWDDSRTTDFAYAWSPDSPVLVSCFGSAYVPLRTVLTAEDDSWIENKDQVFPDMSARKNVRYDKGSGAIFIGGE